jgi:hypothetical protein
MYGFHLLVHDTENVNLYLFKKHCLSKFRNSYFF